jgi:hypothetical protein
MTVFRMLLPEFLASLIFFLPVSSRQFVPLLNAAMIKNERSKFDYSCVWALKECNSQYASLGYGARVYHSVGDHLHPCVQQGRCERMKRLESISIKSQGNIFVQVLLPKLGIQIGVHHMLVCFGITSNPEQQIPCIITSNQEN